MRFQLSFLLLLALSLANRADAYCMSDGVLSTDEAPADGYVTTEPGQIAQCATCPTPAPDGNAAVLDAMITQAFNQAVTNAQTSPPPTVTAPAPSESVPPTTVTTVDAVPSSTVGPTATITTVTVYSAPIGPMPLGTSDTQTKMITTTTAP